MFSFLSLRGVRSAPGPSLVFTQALAVSQAPRQPYTAPSTIRPILASPFLAILLPDAGGGGRVSQVAPLGHRRPGANPTAHRPAVRATSCSRPAAHHHVYPTLLPPIPADHNGMLHIEVTPRVAPRSTP